MLRGPELCGLSRDLCLGKSRQCPLQGLCKQQTLSRGHVGRGGRLLGPCHLLQAFRNQKDRHCSPWHQGWSGARRTPSGSCFAPGLPESGAPAGPGRTDGPEATHTLWGKCMYTGGRHSGVGFQTWAQPCSEPQDRADGPMGEAMLRLPAGHCSPEPVSQTLGALPPPTAQTLHPISISPAGVWERAWSTI